MVEAKNRSHPEVLMYLTTQLVQYCATVVKKGQRSCFWFLKHFQKSTQNWTRSNNGLHQKKKGKENEGGEGDKNEQEGQFTDGKFSAWKYPCFLLLLLFLNQREHIVLLRESTGSLTFLHVGDGVFAHHWRGKRDGDLHFWFLAWKNDDVGFLRVYLHLILIFRKGLPVKRTLCITTEETAGAPGIWGLYFVPYCPSGLLPHSKANAQDKWWCKWSTRPSLSL